MCRQNKALRSDLSKKTEQLKKLFDEYTTQKNVVTQLEGNVQAANQRSGAHEENVRRLEQMVEALGDASTGLHGEQELRMAGTSIVVPCGLFLTVFVFPSFSELQRTNDRLMQESAHRDDECRELRVCVGCIRLFGFPVWLMHTFLQKQVETMRNAAIEQRSQLELRDANVIKLTQEKVFANSQLQVERNRCEVLARDLELMRVRAVDAETRGRPRSGGSGGGSGSGGGGGGIADWWERVKADRTMSLYFGVFGIVFLMLLWYFLASRRTSSSEVQ